MFGENEFKIGVSGMEWDEVCVDTSAMRVSVCVCEKRKGGVRGRAKERACACVYAPIHTVQCV